MVKFYYDGCRYFYSLDAQTRRALICGNGIKDIYTSIIVYPIYRSCCIQPSNEILYSEKELLLIHFVEMLWSNSVYSVCFN